MCVLFSRVWGCRIVLPGPSGRGSSGAKFCQRIVGLGENPRANSLLGTAHCARGFWCSSGSTQLFAVAAALNVEHTVVPIRRVQMPAAGDNTAGRPPCTAQQGPSSANEFDFVPAADDEHGTPKRKLDFDEADGSRQHAVVAGFGGGGRSAVDECAKKAKMASGDRGASNDEESSEFSDAEQASTGAGAAGGKEGQAGCARCLRAVERNAMAATCGHLVCDTCVAQAKNGNPGLDCAQCQCALDKDVCLRRWRHSKVVPARVVAIIFVAQLKTNLPRTNFSYLAYTAPPEAFRGKMVVSFAAMAAFVAKIVARGMPRDAAERIQLKGTRGTNSTAALKVAAEPKMAVGFPGYPDNRRHPKTLQWLTAQHNASQITDIMFRGSGFDSFWDTQTRQYLPLPLDTVPGARVQGEPPYRDDGTPSVACSCCGRWWSQRSIAKIPSAPQLFQKALVMFVCLVLSPQQAW